jgi:hypothetical protein
MPLILLLTERFHSAYRVGYGPYRNTVVNYLELVKDYWDVSLLQYYGVYHLEQYGNRCHGFASFVGCKYCCSRIELRRVSNSRVCMVKSKSITEKSS